MVLYTWGNANVDTTDYTISSVEKVVIQARNGQNADVTMDMAGVGGLESVEIVNFIGGESDVTIDSAPGVVVVDNFQNEDNNINVNFADTVTSAEITLDDVTANAVTATGATVTDLTLNLNGVDDGNSNGYFQFTGDEESALASVTVNVTADSDVFLDFNENAHANLASITINADADFTGGIDLGVDADGNSVTTSLTINGAGDVNINGIWEDDVVDIVYTGSGSLAMGAADEALDSVSGSFNASTATGDVTLYLDLNEEGVESFEFMGSSGVNTVYIDDNTAADAVLDADGNVDANVSIAIAAGDGTEDVLVVTDDADVAEDVAGIYSGFETLRVESFSEDQNEGVDYDLTHLGADFEKIELVYNDADINEFGAVEVEVTAALADSLYLVQGMGEDSEIDLTLALDVSTAADDTMTVNFVNTDEDGNINGDANDFAAFNFADELTINGVESITLNSTGQVEDADENAQWNVIGEFNADQLRTLTITGDVNFSIDENVDANELYLIDATGFTGAELYLEDISVGGGLEYRGSATADQNIDIRAVGDDVLVTTGSGDDNIQVDVSNAAIGDDVIIDAGDGDNRIDVDSDWNSNANTSLMDVVITAGDGDNNIDIIDVRDVTITLGDGNNNVDITYASGDIVVTTGSGDDDVRVDSNENWTSATINVGAGDDRVSLDMNNNVNAPTVEVTLGAGADVLDLSGMFDVDINDNSNVDANYVVDVTDFDVTEDELELDGNLVFEDAIVQDGEYDVSALVDADETVVLEFAFAADNNEIDFAAEYADGNLDGVDLLEAIGFDLGNGLITYDDGSAGYLIAYNGGDAYLFAFADDSFADTGTDTLDDSEIQLIGVFNDVAVGSFSASNFNIGAGI